MDLPVNQIIHGDCLEIMKDIPDGSIDMVFTDPPYKLTSGGRVKSLLRNNNGENPFTTTGECFSNKTPEFKAWIPLLYPIVKESAYVFIMTNDRNMREIWDECEKAGFVFCELLVLNKGHGVPSSYFFKSCEFILMFRKGAYKKFEKFGCKSVIDAKMPKGRGKIHPTEKPAEAIMPIIESCSKGKDVIFDPFAGSGSTAIAALNTGRFFIGIEKEEKYVEIARKRIAEHMQQLSIV